MTAPASALLHWIALPVAVLLASPVLASERELDEEPVPASAREIQTPIQRLFPLEGERPPLLPGIRDALSELPVFFADTTLEARFRTYYLRKDRSIDVLSEAWAIGGSLAYRSGWLKDTFQVEAEGFTSQPLVALDGRGGTGLLAAGQDGYGALGIANAKLRYGGIVLTGYRQYLDLPYVNRQDSRMTPNTFESVTLAKPEGELRFSAGYTWKIKRRTSDEFVSMTRAIGIDRKRGLAHAGLVWDPSEDLHLGAVAGSIPDVFAGLYAESGVSRDLANGWEARIDGQLTGQWDIGEDLLGPLLDDSWSLGLRAAASRAGLVFRLGVSMTGPTGTIANLYGSSPSHVDMMQRTFTRANEKALLASVSYDFTELGATGLSVIANFVAGFDGELLGIESDARELDLTLDYKIKTGLLESFWIRVRGSWIQEEKSDRDGTDVRVILRYDFPVI